MTFRELLRELETMSIQALNQDVRIELDNTHLKVYLRRDKKQRPDGLYVESSEFVFDDTDKLIDEENELPSVPDICRAPELCRYLSVSTLTPVTLKLLKNATRLA